MPAAAQRSSAVILVEGASDKAAVETLARRQGRDLPARGIEVHDLCGVTNYGAAIRRYAGAVKLAGLVDEAEVGIVRDAVEQAGLGAARDRAALESIGFFVCCADLEDELIRALGVDAVEAVIADAGEARAWQNFQRQPAQRNRPVESQLRRFMGTKATCKIRYGSLLVDALELDRVPLPLDRVLDAARAP